MKENFHAGMYSLCLFLLFLLRLGHGQVHELVMQTNPSGCYGGVPCTTQPMVAVTFRSTGEIDYSFDGSVYVQLAASPTGYEKLYYGDACDLTSCDYEVTGTLASSSFINGVASFSNLYLKKSGQGYSLRFFGRSSDGVAFASVTSSTFPVLVGPKYKLFFYNYTGNAFGGEVFETYPTVGVVDRGENVITTMRSGTVTVSLAESPTGLEQLRPVNSLSVPISKGMAVFKGLYINEAGFPYQLLFQCPQCGVASVTSNIFHVAVGNVSQLSIVQGTDPANNTISAGEFISRPPAVLLLDAGGNLVNRDNSSGLLVTIQENPSKATIGPQQSVFAIARQGKVQFSQLIIDHPGNGFTLCFIYYNYSFANSSFSSTAINVTSMRFNVGIGPARKLSIQRPAGGAWAGQQYFLKQPVLWITDYGNNLITTDFSSIVRMTSIPSLSVNNQIVIDTRDAPPTNITAITCNWSSNKSYAAGDTLYLTLTSPYHISVIGNDTDNQWPVLVLNIFNNGNDDYLAKASLVKDEIDATKRLLFVYTVQSGDYSHPGRQLLNNSALHLNGSNIVDGNGKAINTVLPQHDLSFNISTTTPQIISLTANVTSGEYGAGEVIRFAVKFDQEVVVQGYPYLLLNVSNVNAGAEGGSVIANYSSSSDDGHDVFFDYIVEEGSFTTANLSFAVPQIVYANLTLNSTIVKVVNVSSQLGYQYNYGFVNFGEIWIKRASASPMTYVNVTFPQDVLKDFLTAYQIRVNTSAPILDTEYGVQTRNASGIYYPGDCITVSIKFNKPISWLGVSVRIRINAGDSATTGSAFVKQILSDEQTLEFDYIVRPGDNTTHMDIVDIWNSLQMLSNVSYIRRKATFPTTNAILDVSGVYNGGHSLRNNANITLHGLPLTVENVTLQSPNPLVTTTLYPDDVLVFEVFFSGPVVANCTPILVLSMNYYREAVYFNGNGTDVLTFHYKVHMGDVASNIAYRSIPSALCPTSRCPLRTTCAILAASDQPMQPIDIRVPRATNGGPFRLANHTIQPLSLNRNTSITNISFLQPAGEYGVGSVLQIQVTFSDIVIVSGRIKPRLALNINKYASYSSGNYDNKLIFRFITTEEDVLISSTLSPVLISGSTSPINCSAAIGCNLFNQAGVRVNLTTHLATVYTEMSGITLDPTPPNVTAIYFDMLNSTKMVYSAGDLIKLVVIPSKPVIVGGILPRIQLRLSPSNPDAIYSADLSTPDKLVFTYRSRIGEDTSNLSYLSSAIDMVNGYSVILRSSSIPTTPMDVTLPTPSITPSLTINHNGAVAIDSLSIPKVVNLTFWNSSGRYAVGDSLVIQITFSMNVIALGHSRLALNLGDHASFANYFAYVPLNATNSSHGWMLADFNLPSTTTRVLLYRYTVVEDDFTTRLDYTDIASLTTLLTSNKDPGYIKRVDHYVAIDADLTLPLPGARGSLSQINGKKIVINGRTPYLTALSFLTPSGIYSTDTPIWIALDFSASVTVIGGFPSLLLETRKIKNEAIYYNGSNSNRLLFRYLPEPGDENVFLDYVTSRTEVRSAASAFQLNGAQILATSQSPTQPALIWLNPLGGFLKGVTTTTADGGIVSYYDSYMTRKGLDYQIRYLANVVDNNDDVILTTEQSLYVSFSSEYQLRPASALHNELIGTSVDLEGDLAILGAPNFNKSITTIQVVTISAEEGSPQQEIQVIETSVDLQPAIQTFHTTADIGETLGGYFRLSCGIHGPTQPIPSNADGETIKAILEFDFPLGKVNVTAVDYIYCACNNAHTWTITFLDIVEGTMDLLTADATLLTGGGAQVSQAVMLQAPSNLDGTFTLSAFGKTTSAIPYNAELSVLTQAIQSLGPPVDNLFVFPTTQSRTRVWMVTFGAYQGSFEIPQLIPNSSGLFGGPGASVNVVTMQEGRHGPNGLSGYFQLTWRGNTTTHLLPNTTATQMKAALEALPVINTVNVNRTLVNSAIGCYSWAIEFVSVNYHNSRGYFLDDTSNVDPIQPINNLIATQVDVLVDAKWQLGSNNSASSLARAGSFGEGTGAVFIYQRVNESWLEVATVRGNDTSESNYFGRSLSLDDDALIVGAVGATMIGLPEKQAIFCSAHDGYFSISFRGWETDPISCNVTRTELEDAIVSPVNTLDNLHPIRSLSIDDWGGGPLCANHTAVLTFYSPTDGAPHLLGVDTGPHLELLTLNNINLTTANNGHGDVLVDYEVQAGTWILHGPNATSTQTGAAYVFRLAQNCSTHNETLCLKSKWVQEAQFFPAVSYSGSEYGYAVELESDVAIVSAPGANNNSGVVFLYQYSAAANSWSFMQVLKDPIYEGGSRFGHAIAKSGNTLVVSSLSIYDYSGTVYVFLQTTAGGTFIEVEALTASNSILPGINFGYDIAVLDNLLVVGSPGYNDTTIYLGTEPATTARTWSGAVFVYQRTSSKANFQLFQKLTPSNVRAFDRFGSQVAMADNAIIASCIEEYDGSLPPAKAIFSVSTQATYNKNKVGGSFALQWLTANVTGSTLGVQPAAYVTGPIPYNARAIDVKTILERDLPIGEVMVSRSEVDVYDGGYEWLITFMTYPHFVNTFVADSSRLTGSNASVIVAVVNATPPDLRHNTHYFERTSGSANFVEEAYLSPFQHQRIDRCGSDLAMSGHYALVGCPNRDQNVVNRNSGVGFIYDLSLLSLKFENAYQETNEGEDATFTLIRDEEEPLATTLDIEYYFQTLERNANAETQRFIANLYGISNVSLVPGQELPLDATGLVGKAIGRNQFYGRPGPSRWVDGRYDYRAVADFSRRMEAYTTLIEDNEAALVVQTNDDGIVELPAESFTVIGSTPGLWPSILGKLKAETVLIDNATANFVLEEDRYAKLVPLDEEDQKADQVGGTGSTIALSEECVMLFASSKMMNNVKADLAGEVVQFRQENGSWTVKASFTSPHSNLLGFGQSIAVSCSTKRQLATLAIGQPANNTVYIYTSQGNNFADQTFVLEIVLSVPEANSSLHRFGERGAIAIDGELMAIGAPGLETVYLYKHVHSNITQTWKWTADSILRSSDFDYDVILGAVSLHRQHFGHAVAISGRSIVISAPYADYQNLASSQTVENYVTEGDSIFTISKGKAYLFYSSPPSVQICVEAAQVLQRGQFHLVYEQFGVNRTTSKLSYNATALEIRSALMALENCDEVTVRRQEFYPNITGQAYGSYDYCWTITFHSPWTDSGRLRAIWLNHSCVDNCTAFDYPPPSYATSQINITTLTTIGEIYQKDIFQAPDGMSGDAFGWSVAIDDNHLVIGAPRSASMTVSTWDFEAGILLGWTKTGTAFDYQPTYGDNLKHRASYYQSNSILTQYKSKGCGLEGSYYISTYDKHPDDDQTFPFGSIQGVEPIGTLSSDVFMILGDKISFKIGGGCDVYKVFVELMIDGYSVAQTTGKCSEVMQEAYFDVSKYHNRAAQIRIVDNSSAYYGFILVDDFRFDWEVKGAVHYNSGMAIVSHGGLTETILSGAVYVYRRQAENFFPCNKENEPNCQWIYENKLLPSDKRANAMFGSQVAVIDKRGIIAVSAPNAPLFLDLKDTPTWYPYILSSAGESSASGLQFPVEPHNMTKFESPPYFIPQASGSSGVWRIMSEEKIFPPITVNSGAVYIFVKQPTILGYTGQKAVEGRWLPTETARIQPSDLEEGDMFGSGLAVSRQSNAVAIGAPGFNPLSADQGAVYVYKLEFAPLRFEQPVFIVKEGAQAVATVTILRDINVFDGEIVLQYATSDLTARGVDSEKFQACLTMATGTRASQGCGDYEQTVGTMVIKEGVTTGGFTVNIMDDYCYERDLKFILITLAVPGSSGLQGETFHAQIRIDDDDFTSTEQCDYTIQ